MVATKKLYFLDTYRFQCDAVVQQAGPVPSASGKPDEPTRLAIVLDQTVFHPQGGGQPFDVGVIRSSNGSVFNVTDVRQDKDSGAIYHYGTPEAPADISNFGVGETVSAEINEAVRRLHARLHSAGHLLDSALFCLGVSQRLPLKPSKGHHFPTGAFVEYEGILPENEKDIVHRQVQAQMDLMVKEGGPVDVFLDLTPQQAQQLCGETQIGAEEGQGQELPPSSTTSTPKPSQPPGTVRVVRMWGVACPCGGTHVKSVDEIGPVLISKIKSTPKKKEVKVSYQLA